MNSYDACDLTLKTGVSNSKLETLIGQDCTCSYYYAINVLKGKFASGEEAISEDEYYSYYYAMHVLKDRFRLAEERMVKNVYFEYLVRVLGYNHE